MRARPRTMGATLLAWSALAWSAPASEWRLARSAHFEVYSQGADAATRATAEWLEQLRTLVQRQTGLTLDGRPPVRVIAFRDMNAFDPYRVSASSDAYYVGSESRDYIVMAGPGTSGSGVAAHEYAHAVLRSAGVELPLWLREGLAEVAATVRISARGSTVGGDLAGRVQTMQHERWMTLSDLVSQTGERDLGDRAAIFYAQSWALADLVALSPEYAPRFPQFLAALNSGAGSAEALARVFGKSLDAVERDIRQRNARRGRTAVAVAGEIAGPIAVQFADLPDVRARAAIAEVVLLSGNVEHAAELYRELERDAPDDAQVALGLGTLALQRGDTAGARSHWRRAIANGIDDAMLCFRYASLAGMAGAPSEDIRPALLRAVELKQDFDDARYTLALLESNDGRPAAAAAQLRAMRTVAPRRAFSYWTTMADALTQLGDREPAKAAALKAAGLASNDEERRHAGVLAHVADTDLAVRMTRDAEGRPHMVTTRIPHAASDFNPFIEPGDRMERAEGKLVEVECGGELRVLVDTGSGTVRLAIRRLDHVQIRNGLGEFTCGMQEGVRVSVDYAKSERDGVAGDVRGVTFQ